MLAARFILELITPLHVGGGDDDLLLDQPVSRDAFGCWRIPGSAIAGILRAWVHDIHPDAEASLFGVESHDSVHGEGSASHVWCDDAVLLDYDGLPAFRKVMKGGTIDIPQGPFVRDHVRIDMTRGSADQSGKFDEEIVPPRTRFALELKLDGWDKPESDTERGVFLDLCAALASGRILFGGSRSDGFGRVRAVSSECRAFDLFSEAGMRDWLGLAPDRPFTGGELVTIPAWDGARRQTKGISADLHIPLVSRGPLLVGGVNAQAEADIVCLHTPVFNYAKKRVNWKPTVPGSSLRGVVRHRLHDIAQCLGIDADAMTASIFGTEDDGTGKGHAGKLTFDDIYVDSSRMQRVQHVAIDRFTGGALRGALFDEAPLWKEDLDLPLHMTAEDISPSEARVLLHALIDLCSGELPVGNGGNRGNGSVELKDIRRNRAKALKGIRLKAQWNGETVDETEAAQWLDRIEEA